jgi:cystathionine gamma-synthase
MTERPADQQRDADNEPWAPATIAVGAGRPDREPDAPLNPPVTLASVYVAGGEREYGRYGNPTWEAFEAVLGELEGGAALAFASGMAAVSALLDLVTPGETVVAPRHAYLGTLHLLATKQQRGELSVRRVDLTDTAATIEACTDAAVVWLESPTNPMLEVADVPAIIEGAHAAGARVVVDNTFATPILQRPLDDGADAVLHSATKLLSGHADLLLGAVVTRDPELRRAVDEQRRMKGAVAGPMEAWLATRGMRTLHLRVDAAQRNARYLAERLAGHPRIGRLHDPGFGTMLGIETVGGATAADRLIESTSLWVNATSLGGVESTFERRRRWSSEQATVPEEFIRLSVGVEDPEDLWRDLQKALDSLG